MKKYGKKYLRCLRINKYKYSTLYEGVTDDGGTGIFINEDSIISAFPTK